MEPTTNQSTQTNIVIVGKAKSVGTAFLLAFLFGPLGLLYASGIGGLVMIILSIILFVALPIIGPILCWIVSMVWAVVAAKNANDAMHKKAQGIAGQINPK